jgi:hypothetical protein
MATRTHYILRECNARKRRPNRFASTGAANIPRETGQGRRRSHHRQRAVAIRGCLETIQACLRGRREVREGVSQKRCECPCRTPLRSSVALSFLPLSLLSLSLRLPPSRRCPLSRRATTLLDGHLPGSVVPRAAPRNKNFCLCDEVPSSG